MMDQTIYDAFYANQFGIDVDVSWSPRRRVVYAYTEL